MDKFVFAVVTGIFGALLGFFISFISNRRYVKEAAIDEVKTHVKILHQDSMYDYVEGKLTVQHGDCEKRFEKGNKKFEKIEESMVALRDGVSYLVREAKGNPKEFGL